MWGSLGSVDEIESALADLDDGAAYWRTVIESVAGAYYRAGRIADLPESLLRLESRLTRHESLVAVYSNLGKYYLWFAGEAEQARDCYERVLELTSEATEKLWATGALYEIQRLQPGQQAPDFSATTVEGQDVRLRDFGGRIVLLNFWAADCGPCRPEMPHLRSIRKEHVDSELALIGISKDSSGERCEQFVEKERLQWPQIWEPFPRLDHRLERVEDYPDQNSIARMYNVWAIPRAFLIGRNGAILKNFLRGDSMVEAVRTAVEGRRDGDG